MELLGILAGDSTRSRLTAERLGVPLWHRVEDLPENTDLAFVVVRSGVLGGMGGELAKSLLLRGIHVMQEHPVHVREMEELIKLARMKKVKYGIGNLYKYLPEVKNFEAYAKELNEKSRFIYARASFSSQVSYPAMDILLRSLPNGIGWQMENVGGDGAFRLLKGRIKGQDLTLEVHHEIHPEDPNNHMHFMHEIEYVYESGRLLLTNTFGPLLYFPAMYTDLKYIEEGSFPPSMREKSVSLLTVEEAPSFEDVLSELWIRAVSQDMDSFLSCISEESVFRKLIQEELRTAKTWQDLSKSLGYADIVEEKV